MSEILKQKYNQQKKDNVNRMKVEEEIRLQKASEIEAEEEALKQKRVQKMMDFKKMQNEDHMMKLETKQTRENRMGKVADFSDHNVFSYVYAPKVHKSYAMGQKNEAVVSMMKEQFMQRHDPDLENQNMLKVVTEKNKKTEQELKERARARKMKEMEAKFFQDNQVLLKKDEENLKKIQKLKDFDDIQKKVELFKR